MKLCTKNYENPSIFVKVIAKKSVAPFFLGHGVYACRLSFRDITNDLIVDICVCLAVFTHCSVVWSLAVGSRGTCGMKVGWLEFNST